MAKIDKVKKAFSLSRNDILYIFVIIMVGVDIFFTASLIDPLKKVADRTAQNQEYAIEALYLQVNQTNKLIGELNNTREMMIEIAQAANITIPDDIR